MKAVSTADTRAPTAPALAAISGCASLHTYLLASQRSYGTVLCMMRCKISWIEACTRWLLKLSYLQFDLSSNLFLLLVT
jgi:hypothetical protein